MRYKLFGKSGLRVSEVALGTMTFGEDWGWGASKDESHKMFLAYIEAGGNFIDTSINYTNGTSETFVGEFIAGMRQQLVVSTKYSLSTRHSDPNGGGNSRKNMMQSVEASLKRLGTDYIDVYWLHIWDYTTPVEEIMRGLDDLVRAGKVLYVGVSDTPAWVVARANMLAELRGWTAFAGLQLPYNLFDRAIEREYAPMAHALDMSILTWGGLSGGLLASTSGDRSKDTPVRTAKAVLNEKQRGVLGVVQQVASEVERSTAQVALNWVRQQPRVIPILGARTAVQFADNLGCLDFRLTDDQIERLRTASQIDYGFPNDMLNSRSAKDLIFGETFESLDNHRA